MKYHDLTNKRYGRLTVLKTAPRPQTTRSKDRYWKCLCDCGNETIVASRHLKTGHTSSCGCLQKERVAESARVKSVKHGYARVNKVSREYMTWAGIIQRCTNPNVPGYKIYGKRGIQICDRWRKSFPVFLNDVGEAPSPQHSIDRIDNDGNYEPENVRWATASEQSRNRGDRKPITYNGKTQFLVDWAHETGIHIATLHSRLYEYDWSVERTLTTNPNLYHNKT